MKRSSDYLTCSPVLLRPKRVQYVRPYMPAHICSSFTCLYFLEVAGDAHLAQSRFHWFGASGYAVVALLLREEAEYECPME